MFQHNKLSVLANALASTAIVALTITSICAQASAGTEKDAPASSQAGITVTHPSVAARQPVVVAAYSGREFAKKAKLTLVEARAIALKAHPGKITDEELETEKGGSGLRYSFDIKDAKGTQEVGVDANTGRVLENKPEGAVHD